jgi:bacterioferritin B
VTRSASPAFSSRLYTTGHFLQRGRDLQHRFFALTGFGALRFFATVRTVAFTPMPAEAFVAKLNEQIANEFAAHQQYVACAVYYDADTLPELARFFYRQAMEERDHAMMMVRYLLDTDAEVRVPGVSAPQNGFEDVVAPIALALDQEKRVTQQINELAGIARAENDFTSEQFMQWFIKEQVEEVATMSDLLRVAERSRDDVHEIEQYVAREHGGDDGEDATAPPPAGADA